MNKTTPIYVYPRPDIKIVQDQVKSLNENEALATICTILFKIVPTSGGQLFEKAIAAELGMVCNQDFHMAFLNVMRKYTK